MWPLSIPLAAGLKRSVSPRSNATIDFAISTVGDAGGSGVSGGGNAGGVEGGGGEGGGGEGGGGDGDGVVTMITGSHCGGMALHSDW